MGMNHCRLHRFQASMKTYLTLQLSAIILLGSALQASAGVNAQTGVSFTGKEVPLEQVFAAVKKQTGYTFVYYTEVLQGAHKVTLDVKNMRVEDFLDLCLKDQPLTYKVIGQTVMIARKEVKTLLDVPAGTVDNAEIRGKVTNDRGEPLEGASVMVKGSKFGTITASDGSFALKNVREGRVLIISFAGYSPREVVIEDNRMINLVLEQAKSHLDEVQVIAYGQTTMRTNVGDVTTIKSADIEKQPVSNPLLALEGQVPGLFITQTTGVSGSGVAVAIRGQNSLTSGNDPFYVVDGVPYISELLPNLGGILGSSGGNNSQNGSPLNFINPADIESISVLKDADATAIYGSRAANGAIIITTKSGHAGHSQIDLNLQQGIGQVGHMLKMMNTPQYLQMREEALSNDSLSGPGPSDYDINGSWDTTRYTNWQKTLIGNTAQYTQLYGSISGGNSTTQYLIGGTFHRETTVFPENFADQKGGAHFNLNSLSQNGKFRVQLTGNYLIDDNRLPNLDMTGFATQLAPDAPRLYNPDGTVNWAQDSTGTSTFSSNPIATLANKYYTRTNNLIANSILSYNLLPGLNIKNSFGYNNLQTNEISTFPLISTQPELRPYTLRGANYQNNNINSWLVEPQLTYKLIVGRHNFNVLAGATMNQINSSSTQLIGSGYNSDDALMDIAAASSIYPGNVVNAIYRYQALFGRITYSFDEKYIVNMNVRRDGSSRFGPANQFHDFASIGGAWVFSGEQFFKENMSFISFGKLRGSYGTTGNDQISDYRFLSLYSPIATSVPYQGIVSIAPTGLANPDLQWEETKKMEGGLDLGLLKDRIIFDVSYYRNRSSNELLAYSLSVITGFNNITSNFPATIQNSGWEVALNTVNIKQRDFSWTMTLNFSTPRNKLAAFPNLANSSYAQSLVIGQPLSIRRSFHYLGVNPTSGLYQFADAHGNATTNPDFTTDRNTLVNVDPKIYGGWGNKLQYKGFALDFLFQLVRRKSQGYPYGYSLPGTFNTNQPTYILHRWQQPGDIAPIQRYNSTFSYNEEYSDAANFSDASFQDASFIRLRNLSLSWQLPAPLPKDAHLQSLRFYVQGQNLFTMTHYDGLDPEALNFTTLSPLRTITAGLQIIF
jgi:TonB-dependent starch-binding outer membrane protein SusC